MAEAIEKKLSIIHINVNSLIKISRRYDLNLFISKYHPDLVLINETKLNPRHNLRFENYCFIRKDRKDAKRGGGTAILIKNGIRYRSYTNNTISKFQYLGTCIVKIP